MADMNVAQWADRTLEEPKQKQEQERAGNDGATPAGIEANPPNVRFEDLVGWKEETIAKMREASPESPEGMKPNPPVWVTSEATWNRAKEAVRKYWDRYSEPWAVVAHVYNNMMGY